MKSKKTLRTVALALLLVFSATFLFSCEKQEKVKVKSRIYYDFFDTVSTIYDYTGGSEEEFKQVYLYFEDRLDFYHRLFDIYNEYEGINNIATLNRLAGNEPVKVAPELIEFLEYSVQMYNLTGGEVNIAMGSVLSIWHDYRTEGVKIPTTAELEAAAAHTDITKMIIDKKASTVYFADSYMSLDVGAIAKGYTAEKIAEGIMSYGKTSYVIDLGGNLRAIGNKNDGSRWLTGVQNPKLNEDPHYVYRFYISDTSVVTSGDYQRYYTIDGEIYHHIIDKDTLMPADHFSSVTVITEDSGLADALSTALFNMDYESGMKLVSSLGDVSVVWVKADGEVITYGSGIEKVN